MSIDGFDTIERLIGYACKGDPHASRFCAEMWRLAHFFDDVYDRGELTEADVYQAVNIALFGVLTNPFALAHAQALAPALNLVAANWQTANQMESRKDGLDKAYMLRAQLYNLPVVCAFLLYGPDWAAQVSQVAWETYGETSETFKQEVMNHA